MGTFLTFWDSPEKLSLILKIMTLSFIGISAVFGVATWFVHDRISILGDAKIAKAEHTIGNQQSQIEVLEKNLGDARTGAEVLKQKAIDARRNVSNTFDFNGARRQTAGGRTSVILGNETIVYEKIRALYDEKAWQALLDLCESQIVANPDWLTPYLYSGEANRHLGHIELAKERLSYVVENAGSEAAYGLAKQILDLLQR